MFMRCPGISGHSPGFSDWAKTLRNKRVLVITNRNLNQRPFVFGEDQYVFGLMQELQQNGIQAETFWLAKKSSAQALKGKKITDLKKVVENYDVIVLHGISPFLLLGAKLKYRLNIVMPVYFLWNKTLPLGSNLKAVLGSTLWQLAVSHYLATSPRVMKGLIARGIFRKIFLIPPTYKCICCNPNLNSHKLSALKAHLPEEVRAVYIGSMENTRFSIDSAIIALRNIKLNSCTLDIYTATARAKQEKIVFGNITVNVTKRLLSEKEKCEVLRDAQIFIAPKFQSTMNPPMCVLEAEYHGNIVIQL
jgi:hypothetical protein